MSLILSGDTGVPVTTVTGTLPVANGGTGVATAIDYGFKNRIINGSMVIDQRNAGASVTPANGAYTLDRWRYAASQASKFTVQQNAGSVTPPVGFSNYLGLTVASAVTIGSSDYFEFQQRVEGFNSADLGFGTANAKTITVSFWVYSSLTGTFGCSLKNGSANRAYPFTYTINTANTWEYKTVTIAGDTSGTWIGATNGIGLLLVFGLGVGSTYSGTAGAWVAGDIDSATGAVSVVGTNGATFYITGVQLEKGSTATSFDYRPYGTELALCQRYYQTFTINMDAYASGGSVFNFLNVPWQTAMRATPTIVYGAATGGSANYSAIGAGYSNAFTNNTQLTSTATGRFYYLCQNTSSTASAEL